MNPRDRARRPVRLPARGSLRYECRLIARDRGYGDNVRVNAATELDGALHVGAMPCGKHQARWCSAKSK